MIPILYFVSILIAFIYIFIITHILTTWNEIEEWQTSEAFKPAQFISIIVPFRNEAENLHECISSILRNNYPKSLFEIILIDDHSSDDYIKAVQPLLSSQVQLVKLDETLGKKAAVSKGVDFAKGDLVITTDADCLVPKNWLREISSYHYLTRKKLIVGMVQLDGNKNVLEYFQIMDTCGVMGLHGAGIHNQTHFLANGANLIFEKQLFLEIQPYENNEFASGDDVFFVNKVAEKDPNLIGFLKQNDAVVSTKAESSWSSLFQQRKRWATKSSAYSKGLYRWMTGAIWLLSLSIIVNFILIPFTDGLSLFVALTQMLIKGIMDFLYLQNMCKYFDKSFTLKYFIPALFVQTLYILLMGIYALIGGKYEWKERKTR